MLKHPGQWLNLLAKGSTMESVNEEWKAVKGYEGLYEVSSLGRVRTIERVVIRSNGSPIPVRARILKPTPNIRFGYLYVAMYSENGRTSKSVHRLVANAFLGSQEGREVNHIDGDKSNNALANLEYVTSAENKQHARRIGLWANRGDEHGNTKLSDSDAIIAHDLYAKGHDLLSIARMFGVTKQCIGKVTSGKNKRHLGLPPIRKYRKRVKHAS